jgi:phospholipase C
MVHSAVLGGSYGWYDLKVTSDADSTFVRRVAGHVETGRPSMSDPRTVTV